ncbi:hypothetical protein GCM10023353_00520 [Tomitella cavernea]|uniref:Uncharacterized protein n=1 Tax=Tomitella cavernea TaxID=1387982 RepID=A0ABP9C1V5_9ACTN
MVTVLFSQLVAMSDGAVGSGSAPAAVAAPAATPTASAAAAARRAARRKRRCERIADPDVVE